MCLCVCVFLPYGVLCLLLPCWSCTSNSCHAEGAMPLCANLFCQSLNDLFEFFRFLVVKYCIKWDFFLGKETVDILFINSFIHSFNNYLLVPAYIAVEQSGGRKLCSCGAYILIRKTTGK